MNYKYGYCPSCDRLTKWQRVYHHSGEKLWQCMGCHREYRAKVPTQKAIKK